MSIDSFSDQGIGRITSGISKETLSRKTIQFVYEQLPAWRDDPDRPDEQSENKLNLQLCKFLDSTARKDFPMVRFDHEEYQVGRRAVDLSASPSDAISIGAKEYSIYEPFLVLECKRLPAPPPRKKREKEYVTGFDNTSGGIQRFKMGFYGHTHSIAVMIGYIQREHSKFWYKKIREWIRELARGEIKDECSWDDSEILNDLELDDSKCVSRCRSVHPRTEGKSENQLVLHHLWVEMN